jgi:pimeloyl-ACP methyl ester carboxylesterase
MTGTVAGPAGAIAFTDTGAASPSVIVLLHGLGGSVAFWGATIAHLAESHRVVAVDLRGHGASAEAADADYSVAAYARDVLAVLDELALPPVTIVAHSFGATVAVEAAALAPARFRGLVLLDAAGEFRGAPPGALEQFLGTLHGPDGAAILQETFDANLERAQPATRAAVLASVAATPLAPMVGAYGGLLDYRPSTRLARYPGPVLLVVDAANESTFSLHAQEPSRPRRAIAGSSHWLMLDQPGAVHAHLADFLAVLSAS